MTNYRQRRSLMAALLLSLALLSPTLVQSQRPRPDPARLPEVGAPAAPPLVASPARTTASEDTPASLAVWQVETVVSVSGPAYVSQALDAAGHPHVVYYNPYGPDYKPGPLMYARHDGGEWRTEVVDAAGGSAPALVLDAAGRPHISYIAGYDAPVRYARYDGATWHLETVPTTSGRFTSLALDSQGRPHIAYFTSSANLGYARYDGANWRVETVESLLWVGDRASLALDAADRPHISYNDNYHSALKYAYHNGTGWQFQVVDNWNAAQGSSLALDAGGHPHIAYYSDSQLKYARHDGSAWQREVVEGRSATGFISLALDAAGSPHVSYFYDDHMGTCILKYARRYPAGWHIEQVYSAGSSPYISNALALDAAGRPRIAFRPADRLAYATRIAEMADWSRLTFASYRHLNFEVYTAGGAGGNPTRRTENEATDTTPEFNRGATQIAFVSDRDGNPEIYRLDVASANQTRLTRNNAGDYLPTWSPNGAAIAFYSYRDGNAEIYRMGADGANQTRLTTHPAWDGHPTWSPDGARIAFVSQRTGQYELWTMAADGSNQQQLTAGLGSVAYPDWSPDGSRIVFNYDANGDGWLDIAVINANGTGLSLPVGYSPAPYDYLAPVWAPHGQDLAFAKVKWIEYQGNWYWVDAYLTGLDLAGGGFYPLGNSGFDWWPDWQPTDTAAPASAATAPALSGATSFDVRWSGHDPGGIGVRSYDVQYRDGAGGAWTDWLNDIVQTKATFTGAYGHTYCFRCRARDYVYNLEPYASDAGDACTTIYQYDLVGYVLGNRDQPVASATVQASPAALNVASSRGDGSFTLYFGQAGVHTVTVARPGFGPLPPMNHVVVTGTYTTPRLYLPPADEMIADGGFESGNLAAWAAAGEITPTLTPGAHTGSFAVRLGGLSSSPGSGPWRSGIEQSIVVSPTLVSGTLSLLYRVVAAEPLSDTLQVSLVGAGQAITHTLPLTADGWMHSWWDLSLWAAPTLTVRIAWTQGAGAREAGVILDEISVGSSLRGSYPVYLPLVLRQRMG